MIPRILIAVIALLHILILYLEMFVWTTKGKKVFVGYSNEFFHQTKTMAANQGLYNGFLAAGLLWSLLIQDSTCSDHVALFFLSCVSVAGLYGSYTASTKILYIQTIPAVITILFVLVS